MIKLFTFVFVVLFFLVESKKNPIEHDYLEDKGVKKEVKNQRRILQGWFCLQSNGNSRYIFRFV